MVVGGVTEFSAAGVVVATGGAVTGGVVTRGAASAMGGSVCGVVGVEGTAAGAAVISAGSRDGAITGTFGGALDGVVAKRLGQGIRLRVRKGHEGRRSPRKEGMPKTLGCTARLREFRKASSSIGMAAACPSNSADQAGGVSDSAEEMGRAGCATERGGAGAPGHGTG